jgi:hypothetical protein
MSTGSSFGYQQPSYGGMGGMGGYNPFGGMGYGSSMMGGYGQPMGGGYGSMYGSSYSNPYASSYGSTYNPFGSSSYGMSYDPYMSMGFGGGYQQPSSYNPFAGGGFGTTFGGMGGYNQMGGYGQVGLGYLPPPQPTINDTVANQFMQQYYGGAFGLGAQPQPRRQRPRNPFRREQPFVQPAVMDMSSQSTAQPVSSPVGVSQSVVNPIQYDTAALPTSFFSPGAFDRSLLDDLNYMRF